jgi:hypothetical protein
LIEYGTNAVTVAFPGEGPPDLRDHAAKLMVLARSVSAATAQLARLGWQHQSEALDVWFEDHVESLAVSAEFISALAIAMAGRAKPVPNLSSGVDAA